jgi:hypothetical protein
MITENNKCSYCNYNSNRLYNFKRHMMTKHKEINDNKIINNNTNVCNDNTNVCNDDKNVCNDNTNVCNDDKNVCNDKQCNKCNKILSSKQYLTKHLLICKGVSNPLECHLCNKILSDRTSKFNHLKICKGKENSKELIITEKENNNKNEIITFNNTLNKINNITTNSNNVITTNYNINLISYNKEERTIEFDINHMNKNLIYKLTTIHENDAYDYFCYKLFENKNNQMIIKTNLRHIYSNVHLGFNIWEKILDNNIYHIIIYYIAKTIEKYILENTTIEERDDRKLSEILFYIKMMYSKLTMEKYPRKYEKYYKNNIESLKLKFSKFED